MGGFTYKPRAQGHATTITLIADIKALTYRSSTDPDDSSNNNAQQAKVRILSIITHGAKIEAMRSIDVIDNFRSVWGMDRSWPSNI